MIRETLGETASASTKLEAPTSKHGKHAMKSQPLGLGIYHRAQASAEELGEGRRLTPLLCIQMDGRLPGSSRG